MKITMQLVLETEPVYEGLDLLNVLEVPYENPHISFQVQLLVQAQLRYRLPKRLHCRTLLGYL